MHLRPPAHVNHRITVTGEIVPQIELGGGGNTTPPGATAHTYSAWAEYTPATTDDWDGFDMTMLYISNIADARCMYEIAIGSAGNETVVAGPFTAGSGWRYSEFTGTLFVPVFIPRGSRIAVRWKVSADWPTTERPVFAVFLRGYRCGEVRQACSQQAAFGVDQATSGGTITVANTYADYAWREVTAAAPFDVRRLIWTYSGDGFGYVNRRLLEIGIGAPGSERGIVQTGLCTWMTGASFAVDIPAGERVVFRYGQLSNETSQSHAVVHLFG